VTWGSNATGTRSICDFCGNEEVDDLDDWPYTTHHYECPDRGIWQRLKRFFGVTNLPKARVIKR
jgi:hypothetical protein